MSKSIFDTRFTKPKKMALDAAVAEAFVALDEWRTIHGAHVEIDENGTIIRGANGKFNGANINNPKKPLERNTKTNSTGGKNSSATTKTSTQSIAHAISNFEKGDVDYAKEHASEYKEALENEIKELDKGIEAARLTADVDALRDRKKEISELLRNEDYKYDLLEDKYTPELPKLTNEWHLNRAEQRAANRQRDEYVRFVNTQMKKFPGESSQSWFRERADKALKGSDCNDWLQGHKQHREIKTYWAKTLDL